MGVVYQNHQCDGTTSYSNRYRGLAGHETNTKGLGICSECGKTIGTVSAEVTLHDAQDLCDFSYAVNQGLDFANSKISLDDDINMAGVKDFMPIGVSAQRPFRGIFDGNMHRIKNLKLKCNSREGTGLFGCVSGSTYIRNLIMDKSCSIDGGIGLGTAGIVGCLTSPVGSTDQVALYLNNCGNEATVRGYENAAGLVGGVYNNDNSYLHIHSCYNTGNIFGGKVSAAFVGNSRKYLEAKYSWNTGSVTGTIGNEAMMHCSDSNATFDTHENYQLEGCGNDKHSTSVSSQAFALGYVASYSNLPENKWGQNLGSDLVPVFSSEGIRHERTMDNAWGNAVLPYKIVSDDKVKLYQLEKIETLNQNKFVILTPVAAVEANTPFFFKKLDPEATSVSLKHLEKIDDIYNKITLPADNANSVTQAPEGVNWSLTGTYAGTENIKDIYKLNGNQLVLASEATAINPFHAYLEGDFGNVIYIPLPGDLTGDNVISIADVTKFVEIYNNRAEDILSNCDLNDIDGINEADLELLCNLILER